MDKQRNEHPPLAQDAGLRAVPIRRSMPDYKRIVEIYHSSFPKVEQFPVWLLRIMSHWKGIHSVAFYDGETLCGFSYFLVNEETVFILFLAVNDQIRSKGYGSRIISWIRESYPNRVIFLDVERPDENATNNQQRVKRIRFYQNNGIYETNHFFTYDGVTYEILCTDQGFSEEAYNKNLESYFRLFKKKRR